MTPPDPTPRAPDLAAVARVLDQHQADLESRLGRLAAPREPGSAVGFGKRIGDGTSEAIDRLTDVGVGRNLQDTLARVARARAKLDEGTYGTCDTCRGPIPPARLEVMPESVLCLSCADREPRRR